MNWKDLASAGKSIGKLDSLDVGADTKVDLKSVATNLDRLVNTMQAREAVKPDEESVTLTKAQFKKLEAELSASK